MKIFSLQSVKSFVFAACLMTSASASAANAIGEPVTEFTEPELMMLDWPYQLFGTTRTLLKTHLLSFKISAPKAGRYAVEYLVNAKAVPTGRGISSSLLTTSSVSRRQARR